MAEIKQFGWKCPELTEGRINDLIYALLSAYGLPKVQLSDVISIETFVYICHKTTDVLASCKTLEYVHDKNGIGIVGDIHGSLSDLLKCIRDIGWPTEKTILFLGDYVDRGSSPLEVILLLFLLKIRYPKRVILLRGNHETFDQCFNKDKTGLYKNLQRTYSSASTDLLFYNINYTFDHLPLAAIISDQIFCCHGGISQFARRRQDVAHIPRPIQWLGKTTNVFHISIMTDLIWADPRPHSQRYLPSPRNASYTFNKQALVEKLYDLNCRALIRGHEPNTKGFKKSFDGLCYTVHSSRACDMNKYNASVILLQFDEFTKKISGKVKHHQAEKGNVRGLATELKKKFSNDRLMYSMFVENTSECASCIFFSKGVPCSALNWDRTLNHCDLHCIITEFENKVTTPRKHFIEEINAEKNLQKRSKLAAKKYAEFLHGLIADQLLPGTEPISEEDGSRPEYDFEFKLPDPSMDNISGWPFLIIEDK